MLEEVEEGIKVQWNGKGCRIKLFLIGVSPYSGSLYLIFCLPGPFLGFQVSKVMDGKGHRANASVPLGAGL